MVKVLHIAGWQRSGTTVAGNVLGSTPGAMHIGELHYLWMKEHPAGFECGCDELIFECSVWKPVFDELEIMTEKRYEIRQSLGRAAGPARPHDDDRAHIPTDAARRLSTAPGCHQAGRSGQPEPARLSRTSRAASTS